MVTSIPTLFDAEWYLHTYPDTATAGIPPWEHYQQSGWKEGRNPHPLFDGNWYLERNPDVRELGASPLQHYLLFGWKEGRSPHRLFDARWYLKQNPDVALAKTEPLQHYLEHGWKEDREPNPDFMSSYYLMDSASDVEPSIPPLLHYITHGELHGFESKFSTKGRPLHWKEGAKTVGDLSLRGLLNKENHCSFKNEQPINFKKLQIHWVLPDFGKGSGGHMNIIRIIRWLEIFGHQCHVWVSASADQTRGRLLDEEIIKFFQPIKAQVLPIDCGLADAEGDIIFATGWHTVSDVKMSNIMHRFYLVQDHEPEFYAKGSHYLAATLSYSGDLACVTAGVWLEKMMKERYGLWARHFLMAYDPDEYYPKQLIGTDCELNDTDESRVPKIAFYSRMSTQRRAVELGLLALEILAGRRVPFEVHFFGGQLDFKVAPYKAFDHGILDQKGLLRLYHTSDIGLCFSATNYSIVPHEMMASELPVMEIDVESTRAIFPPNVVCFAGPDPKDIADKLQELIENPSKRADLRKNANQWTSSLNWQVSARMVESAILERLLERGVQNETCSSPESQSPPPHATIIIPTLNGGKLLREVVEAVKAQMAPWHFEILVIDSGSTDGTWEFCNAANEVRLHRIPQSEFQHGRTRNLGASMAQGEFLVFITQDALPAGRYWLYDLVSMLERYPKAAGVFGRHLAHTGASPFTERDLKKHFDFMNDQMLFVDKHTNFENWVDGDLQLKQFTHFYSDNNSCMRKSVWQEIPYAEIEFGEDQAWAQSIIEAGYGKVYADHATVYHSHDYGYVENRRRAYTEAKFSHEYFGYLPLGGKAEALAEIKRQNTIDREWGEACQLAQELIENRCRDNEARFLGASDYYEELSSKSSCQERDHQEITT